MAILASLLFVVAALAVDLGNMWSRESRAQTQVDVAAMSAAGWGAAQRPPMFPARTEAAQLTMAGKVAEYLGRAENDVQGQTDLTGSQLLANGQTPALRDRGAVWFTGNGEVMHVRTPRARVDFGFARAAGSSGADVAASATVQAFAAVPPGDSLVPIWVPDGCGYGSTIIFGQQGALGGILNRAAPSWAVRAAAGDSVSVTPTAVLQGSTPEVRVDIGGLSNKDNYRIVLRRGALSDVAFPSLTGTYTAQGSSTETQTIRLPASVTANAGTWDVLVYRVTGLGLPVVPAFASTKLTVEGAPTPSPTPTPSPSPTPTPSPSPTPTPTPTPIPTPTPTVSPATLVSLTPPTGLQGVATPIAAAVLGTGLLEPYRLRFTLGTTVREYGPFTGPTAVVTPGSDVIDIPGTWQVRVVPVSSTASFSVSNPVDFVISPRPTSCLGQVQGNFGKLDSPRRDESNNQKAFPINISDGLDHHIDPLGPAYPHESCTDTPRVGEMLDDTSRDGNNCLRDLNGNAGPQMADGLLGSNALTGRINAARRSTKPGCNGGTNITMGGRSINNDLLSCYLTGLDLQGNPLSDGIALQQLTNDVLASPALLDQDIVNSPRFIWMPVVPDKDNGWQPVLRFVPAFITSELVGVSALGAVTVSLSLDGTNGIKCNGGCNTVDTVRAFVFSPYAIAAAERYGNAPWQEGLPTVVRLVD